MYWRQAGRTVPSQADPVWARLVENASTAVYGVWPRLTGCVPSVPPRRWTPREGTRALPLFG